MMRSVFSTTQRGGRGQALVEFTLTALMFLLMLVMIVEVARILAAYVTIQHAARQAARYAVTGNWETNYAASPDGHYVPGSDDPYARIAPCWPLFQDDPDIPDGANEEPVGPDFYQPYRNARACSVEQAALQGLTGLALDPNAAAGEPNYYIIDVRGYATDRYPETGTFDRDGATLNYSTYFTLPAHVGTVGDMTPGFAGEPNQKVAVRIYYRLPIITPLLSTIVPSLTLTGSAFMTNESFGSTSLQREAVQPPNLPAIPPLGPPAPADLVITSLSTVVATGDVGVPVPFDLEIANVGDKNIASAGYNITLYASTDGTLSTDTPYDVDPDLDADGYPDAGKVIQIGELAGGPDLVGGGTATMIINGTFLAGGEWYIYGWVDSNEVVDEEEAAREANNGALYGTVIIGEAINLSVPSVTPDIVEPAPGGTVDFTVTVANAAGLSNASDVTLTTTLPSGLTYAGCTPNPCTLVGVDTYEYQVGALNSGANQTIHFIVNIDIAITPQAVPVTFTAAANLSQVEVDPSDDSGTGIIYVGGTNLTVTKSVDNTTPSVLDFITYTIDVFNAGPNQATNIEITDVLPGQVSWQSDDSGGAYDSVGGVWTIPTLDALDTATLNIVVQVDVAGSGILNEAKLTALDQPDSNSSDDQSSVIITSEEVDVGLIKTVDDTENYEGGTITYTIQATNNSISTTATNITIVDALPAGLIYDSHFPVSNVSVTGNTVTWTIPSLNPGNSTSLTIDAIVDTGTDGADITNTATMTVLDQADTVPGNDSDSDPGFTVDNRTDLGLSVATTVNGVSGTTASVGDTVVFTWTITNNGPMDATDLSVTVDDILELANWSSITVVDEGGNPLDLSSTLGDLAAGDSMDIIVTAVVGTLAADTTDTFEATVTADTPPDLDDSPGGSTDPEDDSVTVTLLSGPRVFVDEDFNTGSGCFSYVDHAFSPQKDVANPGAGWINDAALGAYASGTYPATGFTGNALAVNLGGINDNDIYNMSGGWSCTFTVASATDAGLTFYYQIDTGDPANYDAGEWTDVVVTLDGTLVGDVIDRVEDGGTTSPLWKQIGLNLGSLSAGNHTVIIGGFNNRKTTTNEAATVYIDNVSLSEPEVLLAATFDTDSEGLVAVTQEAFEGLIGGGTHNTTGHSSASYASGQGNPAGSLQVDLGEIVGPDDDPTNMSAGYEVTFTLAAARAVFINFDYYMNMHIDYDGGEYSYVMLSVDDTTLIGTALNGSVAYLEGGGTINWTSTGSLYLGNLSAGTHTVMIGGFNNGATTLTEDTVIRIDNVRLTAQ